MNGYSINKLFGKKPTWIFNWVQIVDNKTLTLSSAYYVNEKYFGLTAFTYTEAHFWVTTIISSPVKENNSIYFANG